jgi:large subunit ribosomal protein L15
MKLNEISPAKGSTKRRMRIARGVGSGKGKTAGRGVKGQHARSGVAINGFEGGQMPIYMRLPKRGFSVPGGSKVYAWVNLGRLAKAIEAGKLNAKNVTEESLVKAGLVNKIYGGVRLLAKGDAPKGLTITVTGASAAAIEAVEKAGGKVTVTGKKAEAAAE